jgi:lipopolysaccharide assembly outer membrane protein LptD (OstA)
VTVSFDVLTIVADEVRLNKKSLVLEAEGNVIVEDGRQRLNFVYAEVDFKAKDPIATLRGKQ